MLSKILAAGAIAVAATTPAFADIVITDAYARSSMPGAKTGAAFMVIENTGDSDDRLVDAVTDAAARTELHTHKTDGDGIMRMVHVEEGFVIPAGASHALARGGDHVMLMGLTRDLVQGETVTLTLTFEQAGEKTVEVPVDLERIATHGGMAQD